MKRRGLLRVLQRTLKGLHCILERWARVLARHLQQLGLAPPKMRKGAEYLVRLGIQGQSLVGRSNPFF